jgi:hypothetical protein
MKCMYLIRIVRSWKLPFKMQHSANLVLVNITKTTPSWLGGAERTGSKFDFCPGTPWLGGIVWLPGMWRMVVAHLRCPGAQVPRVSCGWAEGTWSHGWSGHCTHCTHTSTCRAYTGWIKSSLVISGWSQIADSALQYLTFLS